MTATVPQSAVSASRPLELANLGPLMKLTRGCPAVTIGLIDGPVLVDHPDLNSDSICRLPGPVGNSCLNSRSAACLHGTFVAGLLCSKRASRVPGICPGCRLLVRTIFAEEDDSDGIAVVPRAFTKDLARAIVDTVNAGARIINLSLGASDTSVQGDLELESALDYALRRRVLVIAAAGNLGTLASSVISKHPWVIPVVASVGNGMPLSASNLGASVGTRGLRAPGHRIPGIGPGADPIRLTGTSVAVPFVTGAAALLASIRPRASNAELKAALLTRCRRTGVVPPMLDAWAAYESLSKDAVPYG